jgi:DNA-binding XRE family transcriptional regulator
MAKKETLASRVRRLRRERRFTVAELAVVAGVTADKILDLEQGREADPDLLVGGLAGGCPSGRGRISSIRRRSAMVMQKRLS